MPGPSWICIRVDTAPQGRLPEPDSCQKSVGQRPESSFEPTGFWNPARHTDSVGRLNRRTDDRVAELSSLLLHLPRLPAAGPSATPRSRSQALAIRATIDDPTPLPPQRVDLDEGETFDEGRTLERRYLIRERDPHARRKKIAHVRQALGHVRCEACGFDFETAYGDRGRDYIECHHRNPLSVAGPSATALGDLALLCSNCHRVVHRVKPWLTVEELAALVQGQHASRR
jgi:hypothetical protein